MTCAPSCRDPRFVVRPAGEEGPYGTSAWLRDTVCRFSEGPPTPGAAPSAADAIARLDPRALHREAARLTS